MSDKKFLEFIREQDSCLPRLPGDDSGIVAAHVRRASNSGVATKPKFAAVPLTDRQHRYQHQHGETQLINLHLGLTLDRFEAHQWMSQQAEKYKTLWEGE